MEDLGAPRELLLIRHAESEWNATRRWQGHADPPLSPRGRAQALALAESFRSERADCPVELLLTSDLRRAAETAEALAAVLGLAPIRDPRLRELDIGAWSGLTRPEIVAREPELLRLFESNDPDARPGGGETRREIRERAHDAIERLAHTRAESRIAIVTHLGFIRALLPGAEPENATRIRVPLEDALCGRERHASSIDWRPESSL